VYVITAHDPRHDTEDEVAELVAWGNAYRARVMPGETPERVEESIANRQTMPADRIWRDFRARAQSGELVGTAGAVVDPTDTDNPDMQWAWLEVDHNHRRRGIGMRLLDEVRAFSREHGASRLVGETSDVDPDGEHFATVIGAVAKSRSHVNRLLLADVDRGQLEGWIADAAVRAADYELIGWDGPVSDDDIDRWIELFLVMNTMPHDDLEQNDFTMTREDVRESDSRNAAVDRERWTLVARRRTDGAWAGFTNVGWSPFDPAVVWVGATAVDPAHRGHALGKWLKAVMTLRVLDERPDVTQIRTGNADSNDAMLGINRAMGYRPWIAGTTWELQI
jgi:GNAT superfamily N-acetyltransferase